MCILGGGQYCRDKGPGAHASARWSPSHPLGIAASPGLARDHTNTSHHPLCLGFAASDHSGVCSAVQSQGINPYAVATPAPAGHCCLAGFAGNRTSATHRPSCLGFAASDHLGVCNTVQGTLEVHRCTHPYLMITPTPAGHRCLAGFGGEGTTCCTDIHLKDQ